MHELRTEEETISVPPIRKSVLTPQNPEPAFRRFTTDVASWWPVGSRPRGAPGPGTIVFDEEEGGHIYHRRKDGETERWGTVELWDPPHRVKFSFHPREAGTGAQTVEVAFEPEGEGTRVTLLHSGWEAAGPGGEALREEFDSGWEPVLGRFASDEE